MSYKFNRNIIRVLSILLITLFGVVTIIAQGPPKPPEKPKKSDEIEKKSVSMLYPLIADTENLRLPENRITVLISIADMLWSHDENRARELMDEAVKIFNTIPNQDMDEDADIVDGESNSSWEIFEIRKEIIQKAAKHDPDFAIKFLTSSKAIVEKLHDYNKMSDQHLEATIAHSVAQSDPKRAFQLAKEYITSTGNTYLLEGIIHSLYKKDPESARNLVDLIINKSRSDNLHNMQTLFFLSNLLSSTPLPNSQSNKTEESQSLLNKKQTKELTELILKGMQPQQSKNKTSNNPDSMNSPNLYDHIVPNMNQVIPNLKQYVEAFNPESMDSFKKIMKESDNTIDPYQKEWNDLQEIANTSTAEKLIELAKNAKPEMQYSYYEHAINKLLVEGKIQQARKIANEQIENSGERQTALQTIENHLLNKYMGEKKFDDARSSIKNMRSKAAKVNSYTQLAQNALISNDKALAEEILNEAYTLVPGPPKSNAQLQHQLIIAETYAGINPNRSFQIIELAIDKCNEMMDASVSTSEFNKSGNVRDGELIGAQNPDSSYFAQYLRVLPSLFHSDSARTESILNSINRSDARIMIKLALLQQLLGIASNTFYSDDGKGHITGRSIRVMPMVPPSRIN